MRVVSAISFHSLIPSLVMHMVESLAIGDVFICMSSTWFATRRINRPFILTIFASMPQSMVPICHPVYCSPVISITAWVGTWWEDIINKRRLAGFSVGGRDEGSTVKRHLGSWPTFQASILHLPSSPLDLHLWLPCPSTDPEPSRNMFKELLSV